MDRQSFEKLLKQGAFETSSSAVAVRPNTKNLMDLHPVTNDRYAWSDIGNGNLFADWYKDTAGTCRSVNGGTSTMAMRGSRTAAT